MIIGPKDNMGNLQDLTVFNYAMKRLKEKKD